MYVIVDDEGQEKTIHRNLIIPIGTTFRPVPAERKAIIREKSSRNREREELIHESDSEDEQLVTIQIEGIEQEKEKMDEAMAPQPFEIQEMHDHAEGTPEEEPAEESEPVEEVRSSTRLRKKPKWHDTYVMSQTQEV